MYAALATTVMLFAVMQGEVHSDSSALQHRNAMYAQISSLKSRRSALISELASTEELLGKFEGPKKADRGQIQDIVTSVARLFSKGGETCSSINGDSSFTFLYVDVAVMPREFSSLLPCDQSSCDGSDTFVHTNSYTYRCKHMH